MEVALLSLSLVQERIQEWMVTMVLEDADGTSSGALPVILVIGRRGT